MVVSASTGHQVASYGPGRDWERDYNSIRLEKLQKQGEGKVCVQTGWPHLCARSLRRLTFPLSTDQVDDFLKSVRAYIGSNPVGTTTTDLELKRLIKLHGGSVV